MAQSPSRQGLIDIVIISIGRNIIDSGRNIHTGEKRTMTWDTMSGLREEWKPFTGSINHVVRHKTEKSTLRLSSH